MPAPTTGVGTVVASLTRHSPPTGARDTASLLVSAEAPHVDLAYAPVGRRELVALLLCPAIPLATRPKQFLYLGGLWRRNGTLATPRTLREWAQLSQEALARFIQTEGAAVWPEAEAKLSETSWVHDHLDPSIPPHIGPQPHHLSAAKRSLQHAGVIAEQTVVLNGRQVTAWVDASAVQHRRGTEVSHQAARKRRLYRRFLGWTSNSRLCGSIAEQVVDAGLQELRGSRLWIPPGSRPGQITDLLGRPIPGRRSS